MLPSTWKPVLTGGLIRLGPTNDGGYVVSRRALASTQRLISMGLNDDWRFEEAFLSVTGKPLVCFDGTVDAMFWRLYAAKMAAHLRPWRALKYLLYRKFFSQELAHHRLEMIGYDNKRSISLSKILAEFEQGDLLLKIDIEGWEYRILDQIVEHRQRLTGVVIEFHDIDLHRQRISEFVALLAGFRIVHLASNNYGGADNNGDPLVIEMSLMRADLVDPEGIASAPHLTGVNDPHSPAIELRFAD